MKRPYTKEEKALLDEMSRSTDPRQEAQRLLEYELEHGSPITRRAFIAELLRAAPLPRLEPRRAHAAAGAHPRGARPHHQGEELRAPGGARRSKSDAPPDAEILTLERTPGSEG
jgi:hypothetical protein